MNKEIEHLLKLKRVPGYRLTKAQEALVEEWEKAQQPVVIKKKRGARKKTTNEVKPEEKETGVLENISLTEES